MAKLHQARLRHATYCLELLRTIGELYAQGGEGLKRSLVQYEVERSNIDTGYSWTEDNAEKDSEAARLCSLYPNAAPYLLELRQSSADRIRWLETALAAARFLNDKLIEAKNLKSLGVVHSRSGAYLRSVEFFRKALTLSRDIGDRRDQGEILSHLGMVYAELGDPEHGIVLLEQALAISREVGDHRTECIALCNLARIHYLLHEFQDAIRLFTASLEIALQLGDLPLENLVINNLGKTHESLREHSQATGFYEQSLMIARQIKDRRGETDALGNLGRTHQVLGEAKRAVEFFENALAIAREIGDQTLEVEILDNLGDSSADVGYLELAVEYYKQRSKIAREIRYRQTFDAEQLFTPGGLKAVQLVGDKAATEPPPEDPTSSKLGLDKAVSSIHASSTTGPIILGSIRAGGDVVTKGSSYVSDPRETLTWLHLSDIHFSEWDAYDENIVLEPLLQDLTELATEEDLHPNFIVVTGDIAYSGKRSEYALARAFFDDLLKVTGLSRDRLFLVPGNHDVDKALIQNATRSIGRIIKDRETYHDFISSSDYLTLMLQRFGGYREFTNDYFAGHQVFDDDNYFYVRALEIGTHRIAILGLNSAWLSHPDDDREHKLVVGERQVRKAVKAARLADAEMKIALLHHPDNWLREFEFEHSVPVLVSKCNFVLHGHLHRTGIRQLVTPDNGAMVLAGGACYAALDSDNSYNIVRMDLKSKTGTIFLREYSNNQGGFWTSDTRLYRNVPDGKYEFTLPQIHQAWD